MNFLGSNSNSSAGLISVQFSSSETGTLLAYYQKYQKNIIFQLFQLFWIQPETAPPATASAGVGSWGVGSWGHRAGATLQRLLKGVPEHLALPALNPLKKTFFFSFFSLAPNKSIPNSTFRKWKPKESILNLGFKSTKLQYHNKVESTCILMQKKLKKA